MRKTQKRFLVSCFKMLIFRLLAKKKIFKAQALIFTYQNRLGKKLLKKLSEKVQIAGSSFERKKIEDLIIQKKASEAAMAFQAAIQKLTWRDRKKIREQLEVLVSSLERDKLLILIFQKGRGGAMNLLIAHGDKLITKHYNEVNSLLNRKLWCGGGTIGFWSGGRKVPKVSAHYR